MKDDSDLSHLTEVHEVHRILLRPHNRHGLNRHGHRNLVRPGSNMHHITSHHTEQQHRSRGGASFVFFRRSARIERTNERTNTPAQHKGQARHEKTFMHATIFLKTSAPASTSRRKGPLIGLPQQCIYLPRRSVRCSCMRYVFRGTWRELFAQFTSGTR